MATMPLSWLTTSLISAEVESAVCRLRSERDLGGPPGQLHFGDPFANDGRVGAGFEGLAIFGEFVVARCEFLACCGDAVLFCGVGDEAIFESGASVVDGVRLIARFIAPS